jgi:hypothetical protein
VQNFINAKIIFHTLGVLVAESDDVDSVFGKSDVVLGHLDQKARDGALPEVVGLVPVERLAPTLALGQV